MLPLPIIGLMILLCKYEVFRISTENVAFFSKISICLACLLYYLLLAGLGEHYGLAKYYGGRLSLFSGNAIPFSTTSLGITVFCFAN